MVWETDGGLSETGVGLGQGLALQELGYDLVTVQTATLQKPDHNWIIINYIATSPHTHVGR